jgi:hypothetical protein
VAVLKDLGALWQVSDRLGRGSSAGQA